MEYVYNQKEPIKGKNVFIAPNASVIGDVVMGDNVNVWYNTVIRGDVNKILIDEDSNIQDNSTIHVSEGKCDVHIGRGVTVGHGVIIHGCKIGNYSLIGMGSILLDGAEIGNCTLVAAGSLVTQGQKIPDGVLCIGTPAKVVRKLTEDEKKKLRLSAGHYVELADNHRNNTEKDGSNNG